MNPISSLSMHTAFGARGGPKRKLFGPGHNHASKTPPDYDQLLQRAGTCFAETPGKAPVDILFEDGEPKRLLKAFVDLIQSPGIAGYIKAGKGDQKVPVTEFSLKPLEREAPYLFEFIQNKTLAHEWPNFANAATPYLSAAHKTDAIRLTVGAFNYLKIIAARPNAYEVDSNAVVRFIPHFERNGDAKAGRNGTHKRGEKHGRTKRR